MTTKATQRIERRSYFDSNVCRLCSFAKDKVLPIFDTSGSKFDAKIEECLPNMNVAPGDGKPQQICLECITNLNIHYEFLRQCIRSDSYFESCIKAFRLKEQSEQTILTEISGEWSYSNSEDHHAEQPMPESIQDLVVVVQLKYKDGVQDAAPKPTFSSAYEGLEPPAGQQSEASISTKALEQAVSISHDNLDDVQQDSTSLRLIDKTSSYFRYDDVAKEYECTLCDKKIKKRSRLSSHLTRHLGIKPHVCEKCDKSFGTKWALNIHARIHRRDIVCEQCGKAFTTNSKLERHSRVHTGEKPFVCSYCGKAFGDKRNLDNHTRTHTGAKPYSCSVCEKKFSIQSHMVEHVNVHKKTASFHCSTCNKTFLWRSNYRKHMKTHC